MPTTYRIGELAALIGRSIDAIRWYEAQGLIPGVQRDDGGRPYCWVCRIAGGKLRELTEYMDAQLMAEALDDPAPG